MYISTAIPENKYFLVAASTTISRVSFDGLRYQVLVNNLTNAVAVDYDYRYVQSSKHFGIGRFEMSVSWIHFFDACIGMVLYFGRILLVV